MKRILTITAVASLLALASCRPEKFGDIVGTSVSNITNLTGSWKLVKATQTDMEAPIKNSPFVTRDITTDFPFADFRLTLNSTGTASTTFATTPGNSPRIIRLATGNWRVDNADAPRNIQFINGTDTVRALVGSYPTSFRSDFSVRIDRVNTETGKTTMRYDYVFAKQ